ncbi:AraC family transcriptional regulator [Gemmobacter caeni]|jgi:AraC-like DNA-binding protein|nr:AraC family transcriptional regulator [Gemmobacter caeni]
MLRAGTQSVLRFTMEGTWMLDHAPRPLAAHLLFESRDLDEARDKVARVFCPHRLDTVRGRFHARQHHLPGEKLSLNYIEYGAKTMIAPGALRDFYLVQIPLCGGASIVNGGDRYTSDPGRAAVLNPHRETTMIWEEGTRQVLLRIDRAAMQSHLSRQLGAPASAPVTFQGALDLRSGAGAALRRLVLWLVAEADDGAAPLTGLMGRQLEETLLSGLLDAHRHDYAAHLGRSRSAPRPRHLRLAESFIEAHLDQPITLEDVAEAAGTSARNLQLAFRQYRGTTPLAFWRDRRLTRAHADLIAAAPGTRVTDVALRWGFAHFGRFAESYRLRFGLTPRDTLRAALGPGYQD